jgi:hypothetical protein
MSAAIYPGPSIAAGPLQYLHRARMVRAAVIGRPSYVNGEVNWPYYAMLTHAMELALKGYVQYVVAGGKAFPGKEPKQHDLGGWYRMAVQLGLPDELGASENIDLLNELHSNHYMRYPQRRDTPIPSFDTIADTTVDHLLTVITAIVSPR